MKAFEHLKVNKLIKQKGLYQRVLQYLDGYDNAITLKELEQFEKSYLQADKAIRAAFSNIKTANKFKS